MILSLDTCDLDHIVEHATPQLIELAQGRLFLTGATGLFGGWLLTSLAHAQRALDLKFDVQFLSRDPERFIANNSFIKTIHRLSGIRGDIRTLEPSSGSFFTHMIHGAATSAHETFSGEPALRKFDTVAAGTRNGLEFAVNSKVQKFLYLSSGAVYDTRGSAACAPISESFLGAPDPTSPSSALGLAKRTAEFFCATYSQQSMIQSIKVARCFSFVGPMIPLDIHYAVGNFIADGLAGRPIFVRGTGRDVRAYMYLSDLVIWLLTILCSDDRFEVYNVGSEDGRSIGDIAGIVAACFPSHPGVQFKNFQAPDTAAPSYYVPSTIRARQNLELKTRVSLEDGIKRTVSYYSRAMTR
jgi:nucleoside-diphosphate-sugar epimerase